ncbi:putative DNA primase/helicase [Paraburkholderia sp. WC7.3g]|uniref:phage/plasmid primase, P4 family n=1 Tax=Paraburkholderia sp. WC7.3g TaxID=2991070 RepID=UPI003D204202
MNFDEDDVIRFKQFIHGEEAATLFFFTKPALPDKRNFRIHKKLSRSVLDRLSKANQEGYNVTLMINRGNGQGRKAEHVLKTTACFIDTDGDVALSDVRKSPVMPHCIVKSSPGHYHAYWRVKDLPCEKFAELQKALAHKFGSDPSVCDLPRVMRVPGTRNWKYGQPTFAKIVDIDEDAPAVPWTEFVADMELKIPADKKPVLIKASEPVSKKPDDDLAARVAEALKLISAEPREKWLRVGMALHSQWPDAFGFDLWCQWARQSSKYDADDQRTTWDGLGQRSGVSVNTIFWMASEKQRGGTGANEACMPQNELELCEMFAATYQSELRYADRKWYEWVDNRWQVDEASAHRRAREFVKGLVDTTRSDSSKSGSSVDRWQTRAALTTLVELAKYEQSLSATKSQFDANPNLLPVKNGVIDLTTQTFRPGRPEDMVSRSAHVEYVPNAKCPVWTSFVDQITDGDAELVRYLRAIAGYTLFGHAREQLFFVLIGNGANGKSVFLNTLRTMLGDYGVTVQNSLLQRMGDNANGPSPALAKIEGRRMIACSEMPRGRGFDEAFVKQLSGNDAVSARGLYSDQIEFVPVAKLFLAVNSFPEVRFDDDAMWRRIVPIAFRRSFTGDQADHHLADKLNDEFPGILNWTLRGARDYVTSGLPHCTLVMEETKRLRNSIDSIKEWLDAECEMDARVFRTGEHRIYILRRIYEKTAAAPSENDGL